MATEARDGTAEIEWDWRRESTDTEPIRAVDAIALTNHLLGYDVFDIGTTWSGRIMKSRTQASRGLTRPIDEYWAESDDDD